ncbi:MAG: PAS-domain containing protein, partial [Pseudomonas marincola]
KDISELVSLKLEKELSDERFQILFEQSQSYLYIIDAQELTYYDLNPQFLEYRNSSKKNLAGHGTIMDDDPSMANRLRATVDDLHNDIVVKDMKVVIVKNDGAVQMMKSTAVLLPYSDAERVLVISTDITPELGLKAKNKTLNAILGSLLQGISIVDHNLELIFCNSRCLEMLDLPESIAYPGSNFRDIMRFNAERGEYGPGNVDDLVEERVKLAKQFVDHKFDRERSDGTMLEVEGHYIQDVGFISTYTDVTERVQAEKDIRESEKLLREIVDSFPFAFSLWSPDGERLLGNKNWQTWFPEFVEVENEGLSLKETILKGIEFGFVNTGLEDAESYAAKRTELNLNPPDNMLDIQKYGDRWLQVMNKKFPSGAVASIRIDITEQYKRDDQLRQAQKMEAVGQLTGGIAHDFNNLLAVVMGNVELLAERIDDLTDPMAGHVNAIIRSANRGAELTQQLLSFSRKIDLRPEVINLNRNIEEMQVLLKSTIGESVSLKIQKQKGLWSCHVDPGQVENSLLNLCLNSRDAVGGDGEIVISTENIVLHKGQFDYIEEAVSGEFVKFSVSDNGAGIAQSDMEQIFEPFFTTKEVGKGSGLGLSMVFGFVRQSNGYVYVHSDLGVGTKFDIYLPRYSF